jgi:hypothetical protein
MKKLYVSVLVILLALLASACSSVGEDNDAIDLSTVDDLIAALEAQGLSVSRGEQLEQPFFSVPAVSLNPAEVSIQIFEYADEAAAQEDAALVADDGSAVGTSMPFWVADPHFFQTGNLIALYLGSDESVLSALEAVMGPQFAGR